MGEKILAGLKRLYTGKEMNRLTVKMMVIVIMMAMGSVVLSVVFVRSTSELWVWWIESRRLGVWTQRPLIDWGRNLWTASNCSQEWRLQCRSVYLSYGKSLSIDLSKLRTAILHDVSYQQYVQRWHHVKFKVVGGGDGTKGGNGQDKKQNKC